MVRAAVVIHNTWEGSDFSHLDTRSSEATEGAWKIHINAGNIIKTVSAPTVPYGQNAIIKGVCNDARINFSIQTCDSKGQVGDRVAVMIQASNLAHL